MAAPFPGQIEIFNAPLYSTSRTRRHGRSLAGCRRCCCEWTPADNSGHQRAGSPSTPISLPSFACQFSNSPVTEPPRPLPSPQKTSKT